MKFTDKDLKTKSLIKSKEKKPCLICKQDTEYIDWCSESRLCSTECEQKFYDLVREQETRFLNGEDIFNINRQKILNLKIIKLIHYKCESELKFK